MSCDLIGLNFFYGRKKILDSGNFIFSSGCTIAASYWDYPLCNNTHLEVELRIKLQSY